VCDRGEFRGRSRRPLLQQRAGFDAASGPCRLFQDLSNFRLSAPAGHGGTHPQGTMNFIGHIPYCDGLHFRWLRGIIADRKSAINNVSCWAFGCVPPGLPGPRFRKPGIGMIEAKFAADSRDLVSIPCIKGRGYQRREISAGCGGRQLPGMEGDPKPVCRT